MPRQSHQLAAADYALLGLLMVGPRHGYELAPHFAPDGDLGWVCTLRLPRLYASFGVAHTGVDFSSIDGRPTQLFFALVAPENSAGIHLKALARISRLFRNPAFRESILQAPDAGRIYALIAEEDARA